MSLLFNQLMERLSPDRTIHDVQSRVNLAINSYSSGPVRIDTQQAFMDDLERFASHVHSSCFGDAAAWYGQNVSHGGRCTYWLREIYGSSGERAAFRIARSGAEGGLLGIRRRLAEHLAKGWIANQIGAIVSECLSQLDFHGRAALAQEYLANFGHLLPLAIRTASETELNIHLQPLLERHPYLILEMRSVTR